MSKSKKSKNRLPSTHSQGDQYVISGDVSGGIITQGRNARVVVTQNTGLDGENIETLFNQLYKLIESRSEDPDVEKEEITQTVQQLEKEAAKGEEANPTKMERWMSNLNQMAPDIVDVILASLGGPVSGVTAILKKLAERAQKTH